MARHDSSGLLPAGAKRTAQSEAETVAQAFEVYYEMGPERSLVKLAKRTGLPFEVLKEWSEAYAWDEKITERNKEMERAFESYYLAKSRDIRNRLVNHMESLLQGMETCSLGLPFAVTSVADLRNLAQAYEALVRANTMAITKASHVHQGSAPKTWSELLQQTTEAAEDHE